MIKIQRASAGSGKTYALARTFILNLLAFKTKNGRWKVRNEDMIEEALHHIIAITFTNKATNEMKQRIIGNLSELSKAAEIKDKENTDLNRYPFLTFLIQQTGEEPQIIGRAAEYALKNILNNYSIFKISTIDSFFQEILRTFAYEANLNDSYQLEIDSSYVNDAALDIALHELDTNPERMGNSSFWLKTIIKNESQKNTRWNLFNKKSSKNSVYSKIRSSFSQLEKEDYKEIKEKIDEYLKITESQKLKEIYLSFNEKASKERLQLYKDIQNKATLIKDIIESENLSSDHLYKTFLNHIQKALDLKPENDISINTDKILGEEIKVFKNKHKIEGHILISEAKEFYYLIDEWKNPRSDSYFKNWQIYGPLFPYFGLIMEIREYLNEVLETNNLIRISDTGYILKKIIGEDDAPFIYERLGQRLENFLIDEFQDTSQMQWDILFPLINESESKGKDNLIIGDPKQSIYRFRNADHTLITEVVPKAFINSVKAGSSKEDNTNWRSHTNIVKFNNYFFKNLVNIIDIIRQEKSININFKDLYENVIQFPHNTEGKGYIEIRRFIKPEGDVDEESENGNEDSGKDWFDKEALNNLGPLITSLINRGYRQKDIGILVNTNAKGKDVVEYLINYNENLPEGGKKIEFMSEESLFVSSSPAINLIINILEKLTNPFFDITSKNNDKEIKENKRIYHNWNRIKGDYNLFAKMNTSLSPVEKIMKFLEEDTFRETFDDLMRETSSSTLPSLVESIVSIFMGEEMKKSDAIYISSFQDIVTEFVSSHPDDPAIFLEWWQTRGNSLTIAAPEGIDAVEIMTIHKSKGLEFKCVIVPFATDNFGPSALKEEWRWILPFTFNDLTLPPVLPVLTSSNLIGSIHEDTYKEYLGQLFTDKLNMYYVAFTRARNELYVFTKVPDKKTSSLPFFIDKIFSPDNKGEDIFEEEETDLILSESQLAEAVQQTEIIKIGLPLSEEVIKAENGEPNKNEIDRIKYFEGYYVNNERPKLRIKASLMKPSGDPETD